VKRGLLVGLAIVVLLVLVPTASAEPSTDVQRYVDLSFTDVSQVEDAIEWREGYVAATQGGLVLWPGEGPRQVLTTTDGMPSNVVWDVEAIDGELLVATERGAVRVDPASGDIHPLDAPAHARDTTEGRIQEIVVTEAGDWWILERGGNLTQRTPDGSWVDHPPVPLRITFDLHVGTDKVLAAAEGNLYGQGNQYNWSVYELGDDGWQATHRPGASPVKVTEFQGMEVVGTREGGLEAFEDGDRVDLGGPESLAEGTVLHLLPDGDRLWVATTDGLYIYRASTDAWTSYTSGDIPSTWVKHVIPQPGSSADPPAMLATADGLLVPDGTNWTYHTGVNGPDENDLLSMASLDGNQLWIGSGEGVNIFFPGIRVWNHWDQSELGLHLQSSKIHEIEHRGNQTWFATNHGVLKLDRETEDWRVFIEKNPPEEGNLYYDVTLEGQWAWMAEWGSGILRHEIGTNNTYKYTMREGLVSHGVTCVDQWQHFVVVCSNEAVQFFDRTKASPSAPLGVPTNRCNTYACNYTSPHNTTFTVLPDGERIWAGSAHGGLLSFVEDDGETVALERQWTPEDGLPSEEVRAIEPASDGVWVGTTGGLAHVTLDGVQQTWTSEDGLGTPGVNDVERLGDVLYIATYEGLHRLDTETGELLPMFEGASSLQNMPGHVSVTFPSQGARLSAAINMTGSASAPGQPVEEIQVRIDDGEWVAAEGTSEWRYRLPVPELDVGEHEAHVRVIANGTDVANTTLPFHVEESTGQGTDAVRLHHLPPSKVTAGQTHVLQATVDAPDPWKVEAEARTGDQRLDPQVRTSGSQVTVAVPVPEGSGGQELRYSFTVQSGVGERRFPQDGRYNATIEANHERALTLETDDETLTASAGETLTVNATLRNVGTVVESVSARAEGLRSSWISASPSEPISVPPGQPFQVEATIEVPEDARPSVTSFTLSVVTEDEEVFDSKAFNLHVTDATTSSGDGGGGIAPTPGPPAGLAALVAGLAAVLARKRGGRR